MLRSQSMSSAEVTGQARRREARSEGAGPKMLFSNAQDGWINGGWRVGVRAMDGWMEGCRGRRIPWSMSLDVFPVSPSVV